MSLDHRNKLPLILWGPVDDFTTGWSLSNVSRTGEATDPFGGTGAYRLEDSGASTGIATRANMGYSFESIIEHCFVKVDETPSNNQTDFEIRDQTATIVRVRIRVNWSTLTAAVQGGSGEVIAFINVGNGWYLLIWRANNIVPANNNAIRIGPTRLTGGASDTGSCFYYRRNTLVVGWPLDNAKAYSDPREGSEWYEAASGEEDAWILGHNRLLAADYRWIPSYAVSSPVPASGWSDQFYGVEKFLETARDKQEIRLVPDRSNCLVYKDCLLIEPMEGPPELEEADSSKSISLKMKSTDDSGFTGY